MWETNMRLIYLKLCLLTSKFFVMKGKVLKVEYRLNFRKDAARFT